MNIGVDSRSLGPMKTGVGTYVSEVLRHWPVGHSPDSFSLFSHQAIAYPEGPTVRHSVAHARWGLSWYLLQAHRLISQNPLRRVLGNAGPSASAAFKASSRGHHDSRLHSSTGRPLCAFSAIQLGASGPSPPGCPQGAANPGGIPVCCR